MYIQKKKKNILQPRYCVGGDCAIVHGTIFDNGGESQTTYAHHASQQTS